MGRNGAAVVIGCGVMHGRNDNVVGLWEVLKRRECLSSIVLEGVRGTIILCRGFFLSK